MNSSDLLQRYVRETGRHLPRRQRKDIQSELYSLLQDSLEERSESDTELGEEEKEEVIRAKEMLREFGPPAKFAHRYNPQRYLIGPSHYSDFKMVLTIVLSVVTGIYLFGIMAAVLLDSDSTISIAGIADTAFSYFEHLLINSGIVIVIFVLIERFSGAMTGVGKKEEWDPSSLPKIEDPDSITRGGMIAGITWRVIVAIVLVVFPYWIGVINFNAEGPHFTAILAPEFDAVIPWIAGLLIMEAGLYLRVLRSGRWTTGPRWTELIINLAWIVLFYLIITGGPITTIPILTMGVKVILTIILIIAVFEVAGRIYRLLTSPPGTVWQPEGEC